MPKRKPTVCPISRDQFVAHAPRLIPVVINGRTFEAELKMFASGSFGFFLTGKSSIQIAGELVPLTINCCVTCIGSKPGAVPEGAGAGLLEPLPLRTR